MSNPDSGFKALGLRSELLVALDKMGLTVPTPAQLLAIPPLRAGRDALIQAPTGSGKTLAYGLPLLDAIAGTPQLPRVLVLVPTRELALQVRDVLREAARKWRPMIHAVMGGEAIEPQVKAIAKGAAILVATPGRAHDLLRRGAIAPKHCRAVVLDEADEMLLRGFKADLDAILAFLPPERQTILVSATLGPEVRAYAQETMRDPVEVGTGAPERPRTLQHLWVQAPPSAKGGLLERTLRAAEGSAIVFVARKDETKRLALRLRQAGFAAAYLQGDLPLENRKETLQRFRDGLYRVLVATDVAARGLDVPEVDLVVNYSVPPNADQYLHRSGRAGRAGREGRCVTLSYREEREPLGALKAAVPLEGWMPPPMPSGLASAPWRPPHVEEEPVERPVSRRAVPEREEPPRRAPKLAQHLGWHEDRPARPPRGGRRGTR